MRIVCEPIVGHADQDRGSLRVGRVGHSVLAQSFKLGDCFFELAAFEKSQSEIDTQRLNTRSNGESSAIVRDGFLVMPLSSLEQADVRHGFGVGGMSLEDLFPRQFCCSTFALLLEGERFLAARIGDGIRLGK